MTNLFDLPSATEYEKILSNTPDKLSSKFKLSYGFLLNLLPIYQDDISQYTSTSMIVNDIQNELQQLAVDIKEAEQNKKENEDIINKLDTPWHIISEYYTHKKNLEMASNKTKKKLLKEIKIIEKTYPNIESDNIKHENHKHLCKHLYSLKMDEKETKDYINNKIEIIRNHLIENNFITFIPETEFIGLTTVGSIASNLKEVHSLAFANAMYKTDNFYNLDFIQLAGVFSCFTNISIQDELKDITIKSKNEHLKHVIETIHEEYDEYDLFEKKNMLDTGECYDLHYDLIPYIIKWCEAKNEEQCKLIVKELYHDKGVFLG